MNSRRIKLQLNSIIFDILFLFLLLSLLSSFHFDKIQFTHSFSISNNDDNGSNVTIATMSIDDQQSIQSDSHSSLPSTSTTSTPTLLDCKQDEFRCLTSMECIPKWWRCDHIIDCQDGSDEWQQSDFNLLDYQFEDEDSLRSYDHQPSLIDKDDDDEQHSSANTYQQQMAQLNNLLKEYWCQPCDQHEMFRCEFSGECISRGWMCDGQLDCARQDDNSDEDNEYCRSIRDTKLTLVPFDTSATFQPQPSILLYNQTHFRSFIRMFTNSSNSHQPLMIKIKPEVTRKMNFFLIKNGIMICQLDRTSSMHCYTLSNGTMATHHLAIKLPQFIDASKIDKIQLNSISNKWYLLDRTNELLYQCDYHCRQCSVVIDHQILSRPLDFVLDEQRNLLFISRMGDRSRGSSHNRSPAIFKVNLSKRITMEPLIQMGIIESKHMAVDTVKQRLYWIDTKLDSLESVDYHGNNRHRLKVQKSLKPMKLIDSSTLNSFDKWPTEKIIMYANDDRLYLLSMDIVAITTKTNITKTNDKNDTKHNDHNNNRIDEILKMNNRRNRTIIEDLITTKYSQVSIIMIHLGIHNNLIMRQTYRSDNESVSATIIFPNVMINNLKLNDIDESYPSSNNDGTLKTNDQNDHDGDHGHFWANKPVLIYSRLDPGLIKFRQLSSIKSFVDNNETKIDDDNKNSERLKSSWLAPPITFSRLPTTFDIDPFERKIYYLDDYDTKLLLNDIDIMFGGHQTKRNDVPVCSTSPSFGSSSNSQRHCRPNLIKQQQKQPTTAAKTSNKTTKRIDLKFFGTIDRSIESISFDWCNKNIYLLERKSISVIKFVIDGHKNDDGPVANNDNATTTAVWKKVIITNLIEPTALALDPERALMFFAATIVDGGDDNNVGSTTNGAISYSYSIRKCSMDGSNMKTMIRLKYDKSPTSYANAITLDHRNEHLYWCETIEKTINRVNYDGTGAVRLLQSSRVNIANSMVYFNHSIYWTELQHGTIQQFDLLTNQTVFLISERAPLSQMKIIQFPINSSTKPNECFQNENHCEQLTLRTSRDGHVNNICSCDDHFRMDPSNPSKCIQLSPKELTKKYCNSQQTYLVNGRRCILVVKLKAREAETSSMMNKSSDGQILMKTEQTVKFIKDTEKIDDSDDEDDETESEDEDENVDSSNKLSKKKKQCQAKEFSCDDGRRCIPYHWLCDGHKDCHDQTDEKKLCQIISLKKAYKCPDGYFQCVKRPLCIPENWRCDQQQDCGQDDPSDEEKCNN